jgi:DNA-binding MarR family transcriptional regulator
MTKGRAALERPTLDRGVIVSAGLEVLDCAGLDACTPELLAEHMQVEAADLALQFPTRDALLTAVADELLRLEGDEPSSGDWQTILLERASRWRRAMLSRREGALLFGHLAARSSGGAQGAGISLDMTGLAPSRHLVLALEHLTIGYALVEQSGEGAVADQGDFEGQVNLLLSVASPAVLEGAEAAGSDWQSRFQARLWAFLRDARESANISFARTTELNELDRRILLMLEAQGGMTLAAISMACGVDKAQVSRAIKRMDELQLLTRSGIRGPIRLSAGGKQLAERLLRHADLRNRELTFGISDGELRTLSTVLDTLLSRAIALFEQERKQAAANQRQETVAFQDLVNEGLPGENGVNVVRTRVLPPFVTLCSYVLRGGALAHKRQTGLSNFESWVMSEICRNPPISWPQLVLALSRDQSQAGRTINHLIGVGLVERSGRPGRRHGFFAPTAKGLEISEIVESTAVRRSEFLFQGIPAAQLEVFMAAFETLAHNAEVQLAREKAIRELERP